MMQCCGIPSPASHSVGSLTSEGSHRLLSAAGLTSPRQGPAEDPAACHTLWAMCAKPFPWQWKQRVAHHLLACHRFPVQAGAVAWKVLPV